MKPLEPPDSHHLRAAQGWLDLGNWAEAKEDLEQIAPQLRVHPDVLCLRYGVHAAAKQWEMAAEVANRICRIMPEHSFGWVHRAYALHELRQTAEAWSILLPVADKFPDQWVVPYNLACYAVQLGDLKEGRRWLQRAFEIGGEQEIKLQALEDPDLEPLRKEIGNL